MVDSMSYFGNPQSEDGDKKELIVSDDSMEVVLLNILKELKKMNLHLAILSDTVIPLGNPLATYFSVIARVFFDSFESTGGSGSATILYYRNPTIVGGSSLAHSNTNYGAANSATGTLILQPSSMTGTVWWTGQLSTSASVALEEGRIVLPSGTSHGISIIPPTGNTSYDIAINIAFYQVSAEEMT